MPSRSDFSLGHAALARGILSDAQFWDLVRELAGGPPERTLSALLVARGIVTGAEVPALEALARRMDDLAAELRPAPDTLLDARAPDPVTLLSVHPVDPVTRQGDPPTAAASSLDLSPPPADLHATLGKYRILGELGRGGMGVVYKALDPDSGRIVALKALPPAIGAGEERVQRFQREVRTAASLRHPNIVAIHDVGAADATHFFTMDYVAGRSLSEMIADKPLPVREALGIIRDIAGALAYAHAAGIVHRDIKPSNILIDARGTPFLTDFGLAKEIASDHQLTLSGQVMGTPSYMSPEQANGELGEIDGRSDVYSLGAVLYECLARVPPFEGSSPALILYKTMQMDPEPLRKHNARVHPDVETICLKALQKEKTQRYPGARELADDLGRFLEGEPILARPVGLVTRNWRRVRKHRLPLAAVGACLTALVGFVGYYQVTTGRMERAMAEERAARERREQAEAKCRKALLLRGPARTDVLSEAVKIDPDYAAARDARALEYYHIGNFVEAWRDWSAALVAEPADPVAALGLARFEEEVLLDPARALAGFRSVAEREGTSPFGRFAEACVARRGGNPQKAAGLLREIPAQAAVQAAAHRELASACLEAGDPGSAASAARRALELEPDDLWPRLVLAAIAERDLKYEEAVDHLGAFLGRIPLWAGAHHALGRIELYRKRPMEAVESLTRALQVGDLLRAELAAAKLPDGASLAAHAYPERGDVFFLRGLAHAARGTVGESADDFQACLAIAPRHAPCLNALGKAHLRAGAVEEARKLFQSAIDADPGFAEAYGNLADLLDPVRDGARRRELFLRNRELDTRPGAPWTAALAIGDQRLGELQDGANQSDQQARLAEPAVRAYELGLLHDARCVTAIVGIAVAAVECMEPQRAWTVLEDAVRANPCDPRPHFWRGIVARDYPALGLVDRAGESLARAAELAPDDAETAFQQGFTLERAGKREEAIACYDRALTLDPGAAHAYRRRAECHFAAGRSEPGQADYRKWREAKIDARAARRLWALGEAYYDRRDDRLAVYFYDQAIDRNYRCGDAYYARSRIFQHQNALGMYLLEYGRGIEVEPERDIKHYTDVVILRSKLPFLLSMASKEFGPIFRERSFEPATQFMAGFLSTMAGDWQRAARYYRKTLELNPDFVSAHTLLGYALYRLGETEEGGRELARTLAALPTNPLAYYFRSCMEAGQGRKEAALDLLAKAVGNGFFSKEVAVAQPEFKDLLGEPRFQELFKNK